jgi:SpoVK/Ycf46/Vps4 family AAA+-type ATPase
LYLQRGIDLKKIGEGMTGASGAELKAVCTEAGMFALRERRVHVTQVRPAAQGGRGEGLDDKLCAELEAEAEAVPRGGALQLPCRLTAAATLLLSAATGRT